MRLAEFCMLSALTFIWSCDASTSEPARCKDSAPIPSVAGLGADQLYAVALEGGRARVGGFDGAAQPGARLDVVDARGVRLGEAFADPRGRFRLEVEARAGDALRLGLGGDAIEVRVRDSRLARAEAVCAELGGAGSVPNDLVWAGEGEAAFGILVRSGDNAIGALDPLRGLDPARTGVRLPELDGVFGPVPANPWFVAPLDARGARVVVTAFLQHRAYVVRLDEGKVEATLEVEGTLPLDPPFRLARPYDLDGDGALELELTQLRPRSPQAVAVTERMVVVAFSGYVEARRDERRGPVHVPSVLAVWNKDALDARPRLFRAPADNPQELRALGGDELLVVSTGVLDYLRGEVRTVSPGAVHRFDASSGQLTMLAALEGFAPSTALLFEDVLWVGSLARAALRRIPLAMPSAFEEVSINEEAVDSIFRLVELGGGLAGVPSFNTDRLHVLDMVEGVLDPAPFFAPLALGPGRPVFDGLQLVARRPGRRGLDYLGPELLALSGPASRLTPVFLRAILGP